MLLLFFVDCEPGSEYTGSMPPHDKRPFSSQLSNRSILNAAQVTRTHIHQKSMQTTWRTWLKACASAEPCAWGNTCSGLMMQARRLSNRGKRLYHSCASTRFSLPLLPHCTHGWFSCYCRCSTSARHASSRRPFVGRRFRGWPHGAK